ncbi:Importin subunit alpha-1b, partial [Mucuna pruriens]
MDGYWKYETRPSCDAESYTPSKHLRHQKSIMKSQRNALLIATALPFYWLLYSVTNLVVRIKQLNQHLDRLKNPSSAIDSSLSHLTVDFFCVDPETAFIYGLWPSIISADCKLLVTSISIFESTVILSGCRDISSHWQFKLPNSLLVSLSWSSLYCELGTLGLNFRLGELDSVVCLQDCLLGLFEPNGEVIINHQSLPCLLNLLTNNYKKKSIEKEACWTISNITAGNKHHIQVVIEANVIIPLVNLLQNAEFDIKKEAAWAISNATSGGSHEQIKYLVSQGYIKPLCDLLIYPNLRIVTVCLEGLENILKVGEADKNISNTGDVNLYAQMIDDAEGLEKIENLQSHDNTEEEDETMPPGDASQSGFNFGNSEAPAVPSGGFNFN